MFAIATILLHVVKEQRIKGKQASYDQYLPQQPRRRTEEVQSRRERKNETRRQPRSVVLVERQRRAPSFRVVKSEAESSMLRELRYGDRAHSFLKRQRHHRDVLPRLRDVDRQRV